MASQPKIRVVKEADDTLEDLADQIDAGLEQQGATEEDLSLNTGSMIAGAKKGLVNMIGGLRGHASLIEQEMSQAAADFDKAVAAAKALRDSRIADCQAELFQVNHTISALDGARAKLAARS